MDSSANILKCSIYNRLKCASWHNYIKSAAVATNASTWRKSANFHSLHPPATFDDGDKSAYRRETDLLVTWCIQYKLELNAVKTVKIGDTYNTMWLPSQYCGCFLGTIITLDLKWVLHIGCYESWLLIQILMSSSYSQWMLLVMGLELYCHYGTTVRPAAFASHTDWTQIAKLAPYQFDNRCIPGPKNVVADALSQEPFVNSSVLHHLTRVSYDKLWQKLQLCTHFFRREKHRWPQTLKFLTFAYNCMTHEITE